MEIDLYEKAISNFSNLLKQDPQFFALCMSIHHFYGEKKKIKCKESLLAAKTTMHTLKAINDHILEQIKQYKKDKK